MTLFAEPHARQRVGLGTDGAELRSATASRALVTPEHMGAARSPSGFVSEMCPQNAARPTAPPGRRPRIARALRRRLDSNTTRPGEQTQAAEAARGVFATWQPRYAEHRVATFP